MATIGSLFVNLNANTSNFESGMSNASNRANSFGSTMSRITENIKSFLIYDIGKKLVSGFGDAIKAGINYNATLEQSSIKWETLLGSQEKANKMLKDIEKFAADTPFEKMGVDKMAGYLNNAGFEGKNLFNQLTKFGDIAGAFSVQNADLEEMTRQYAQVRNAGVAYTEDLNILEDKSVPIMKNIAEVMKIPQSEVKKMASEGKISFDIYNQALDNIAKKSEGGMAKMSESFTGVSSTISDTMGQIAGTLSKPIFDKLKEGAVQIRDKLSSISDSLNENGLMGTIKKFAPGAMPFIQSIIGIFDTLKNSVKVIIDAIMGFWNEHKSWLLPLITFVWGFVATFISQTITAIGVVVQSGLAVIDGIINFFQNLAKGNFKGAWESIVQIFKNALTFVWNYMQVAFAVNLPGMIKNFGTNFISFIKNAWSTVTSSFSSGVSSVWNFARSGFSNVLNSVIQYMRQVPTNIKNFMTEAVNTIKNINLFEIGKNMIQGLINGIKNMASNVIGAIGSVVTGAVNAAKKKLGINSPSKVFTEFGEYTGEGLAIGIDKKNKQVAKASTSLANSVIGGYSANLKGIKVSSSNSSSSSSGSSNLNNNPININFYDTVIQNEPDIERIATELAFYIKRRMF